MHGTMCTIHSQMVIHVLIVWAVSNQSIICWGLISFLCRYFHFSLFIRSGGIDRGASNFAQMEDFARRSDIYLLHLTDFIASHDAERHAIAILIGVLFYASIGDLWGDSLWGLVLEFKYVTHLFFSIVLGAHWDTLKRHPWVERVAKVTSMLSFRDWITSCAGADPINRLLVGLAELDSWGAADCQRLKSSLLNTSKGTRHIRPGCIHGVVRLLKDSIDDWRGASLLRDRRLWDGRFEEAVHLVWLVVCHRDWTTSAATTITGTHLNQVSWHSWRC